MKTNAGSLQRIFEGFSKISKDEKIAYLKYLILVIERKESLIEKNRLIRFKTRLEKSMKNQAKSLKTLEKQAV